MPFPLNSITAAGCQHGTAVGATSNPPYSSKDLKWALGFMLTFLLNGTGNLTQINACLYILIVD